MSYTTAGRAALGSILNRSGDSGSTYSPVAEIFNLDGPSGDMVLIDVTHHQSTSGYREYRAGLKDGGDVTLQMNFLPSVSGQTALRTDFENQTVMYWRIDWPDGAQWKFQALVKQPPGPAAPFDGKLSARGVLKVTGPVTQISGS